MIRPFVELLLGDEACIAHARQLVPRLERVVGEIERTTLLVNDANVEPVPLRVVEEKSLRLRVSKCHLRSVPGLCRELNPRQQSP